MTEELQKAWDEFRVWKSRTDHFAVKVWILDRIDQPTEDQIEQKKAYFEKQMEYFKMSAKVWYSALEGLCDPNQVVWKPDGSCYVNGVLFQY
jgi:hypothetical protein